MPKLSDSQLVVLSAAAQRDDGITLPLPKSLKINKGAEATGWQAHSVRGAISGTLKKKLGFTVTSDPHKSRGRVYRIADR